MPAANALVIITVSRRLKPICANGLEAADAGGRDRGQTNDSAYRGVPAPIVLARWRWDRKAGNGILIEGSPSGEQTACNSGAGKAPFRVFDRGWVWLIDSGKFCPSYFSQRGVGHGQFCEQGDPQSYPC